jgi:hypothetical protein
VQFGRRAQPSCRNIVHSSTVKTEAGSASETLVSILQKPRRHMLVDVTLCKVR